MPEPTKREIERFGRLSDYSLLELERHNKEPSCFNGIIEIERYRITVEKIEEPKEVLGARLQSLWEKCDNWHHHDALKATAKWLGIELMGDFGSKREDRIK